ncbi:MAG TPA: glycogen phosphorylase [Lentisphaeria bacterium]|nr:MAG: glycogen phosphorylase [Lentisphaerae bacterium GWF2_38_69]HBM17216.1 glycogen phosphorylase [Lentisphaeria bacterium]
MEKPKENLFFTNHNSGTRNSLKDNFYEHLEYTLVKDKNRVTTDDTYRALAYAIRDKLVHKYLRTKNEYNRRDAKKVYYLSMEFLMGRLLGNILMNLFEYKKSAEILAEMGYDLEKIREIEPDMGLGNGGLGRLAACFLDSLATLQIPGHGYTIRYEHGIFRQTIVNGEQHEVADQWLEKGNPWEIPRSEINFKIRFNGKLTRGQNPRSYNWIDAEVVDAMAYDILIPGYMNNTVNYLRMWKASSTKPFDFNFFNSGDYINAVLHINDAENISKVLYPNDNYTKGKILRLKQEYFLVSASLQDIIRQYKINHKDITKLHEKIAIQLNDTHPALAVPELMRILVDEEGIEWKKAWDITVKTCAYTNHTVLPEALECWPMDILNNLLPRHMQIIFDINQDFLDFVGSRNPTMIPRVSIIEETGEKRVRMANLAIVGSHSVNGVAKLHSEIIKNELFREMYSLFPERFNNKTNGITPRRWLKEANYQLFKLIAGKLGYNFIRNLDEIKNVEQFASDKAFAKNWQQIKLENKIILKKYIKDTTGIEVNEHSIFDVQIKRLHEYKRQLLNALHVITLYKRIKENPNGNYVPRTVIFAGKAAPGYHIAKLIIKLINYIGFKVNNDPVVSKYLKVVYLENYSVSLAEKIIAATDLSEQISTAGYEASGTGNMKFALNGALTIGTMDGANIEMSENIGEEHMFIFGLRAHEVKEMKAKGYNPMEYYNKNSELKAVMDMILDGEFSPNNKEEFKAIYNLIMYYGDTYMLMADYEEYIKTQEKVSELYKDKDTWTKKAIINSARMGFFSSDRTIMEYAKDIWKVSPVEINLE